MTATISGTTGLTVPTPVTASNGGTGIASPGTSGNVLVSNGTAWVSGSVAQASGAVYENAQTISANYTMTTSKSGLSAGPVTVSTGYVVTIPSGSRWVIL